MTQSNFIQRYRTSGAKITSIALAVVLMSQLVLGTIAQAALVDTNEVGTNLIGFDLDGTTLTVDESGQQAGAGEFAEGQINDYPEGSCIPALITVTNNSDEAGDIAISPMFDYSNSQNSIIGIESLEVVTTSLGGSAIEDDADDLSDFAYSLDGLQTATSFPSFTVTGNGNNQVFTDSNVSASVSGPYSGNNTGTAATTATDEFRHYNVTLLSVDPGESVVVVLCARIGVDASEWQGATPSLRLAGEGQENVGIQTSQLLALPTLTLIKEVVGSDELATSWSFNVSPTINGEESFSTTLNQDGTASVTIENVSPDGSYAITETGPDGYILTEGEGGLNCSFDGDTAYSTLTAGKPATNATCVFVNTFDEIQEPEPATLIVIKDVINDNGGTAVASDFTMNVSGTNVSDASFPGAEAPGTTITLDAGSYSVTEVEAAGYAASSSADCSGTIAAGQTKTCTITNDDIAPILTVNKIVSGGDKDASEFTLLVDQTTVSNGIATPFDAGTYTVSEVNDPAYASAISGDCDVEGGITLTLGDVKECTITNTYTFVPEETGTITVVKVVEGGNALVSDFPLFIGQMSVTSGDAETLPVGNYTVSETNEEADYVGSFSGDCDENGNVSLDADQDLTCTITNTYVPPAPTTGNVTVTKIVINDDETASSQVSDFVLKVGETTVTSGESEAFTAGAYVVSESGPTSGYDAAFSGDCDENGNLTVVAGQSYSCTITNDDKELVIEEPTQGTLTVVKVVINNDGGTAVVADFPLSIDEMSVTSGSTVSLAAGQHTVSEIGSVDYVASFSGDCDVNGVVNLEDGDEKTCTITNDDKAHGGSAPQTGTLIVVTNVINDGGGEATPSSFLMTVGDGISTSSTFGGMSTPGFNMAYAPGAFVVNGSTLPNYSQSMSANCSGTMLAGQTLTCVVTYTYQAPPTGGSPVPPTPPAPPAPVPQVQGASNTDAVPVPQVLGATDDDLPVTGMPAWTLAAVLLAAAPFLRRKRA